MKPPPLHERLSELPPRETPALVAFSGGRDSVTLLHLLLEAGHTHLVVCHLNHQLRGAEALADAEFARSQAASLGLIFEEESRDIGAEAARLKLSVETAARQARWRFFSRIAAQRGISHLFLGHHADDQVETLLWHLFRGAGRSGLGAMAPRSTRPSEIAGASPLALHRPMLHLWREEINAYIASRGLLFREDSSNATLDYTRNKIRLDLLPHIATLLGRDPRKALWRTADLLRHEEEWLEGHFDTALWADEELSTATLALMPVAAQRRALHRWLKERGVPAIGYAEVENVRSLLTSHAIAKVNLPGGWHARRREKRLFLEGPHNSHNGGKRRHSTES